MLHCSGGPGTDTFDMVTALEMGADDYVTKPIDFPVVMARLKTQLQRKRAEDYVRESEERYALAAAGANAFVAGSAVFKGGTMEAYRTNISAIRSAAAMARGEVV